MVTRCRKDKFHYAILIPIKKIHHHPILNPTGIKLLSRPYAHRVTGIYLYSYPYQLSYYLNIN